MKLIAYCRVSTDKQEESPEVQITKIRQYCQLYGHEIVEHYVDDGYTSANMDRPGLQNALKSMKENKYDGIIVSSLHRLTRSISDGLVMFDQFFTKAKYELVCVNDAIDTSTASGRLVINILLSVFQWEREAIAERTTDVLQSKKKNGKVYCKRVYGFDNVDGQLVKNENEHAIMLVACDLRCNGFSYKYIADHFSAMGYVSPSGGTKWHSTTVRNIVLRYEEVLKSGDLE